MLDFNDPISRSDGTLTTLKNMVQSVDHIKEALTGPWTDLGSVQVALNTTGATTDITSALTKADIEGYNIKIYLSIVDTDADEDFVVTEHFIDGSIPASMFPPDPDHDPQSAEIDSYYYHPDIDGGGIVVRILFDGATGKFKGTALNIGSYSVSDVRVNVKISKRPKLG